MSAERDLALIEKHAEYILRDLRRAVHAARAIADEDSSPLRAATYDGGAGDPNSISDPTAAAALSLSRNRGRSAMNGGWQELRKAAILLTSAANRLEREA